MATDAELLSQYCDQHSQRAFAELVRRHVDVVYGTALRRLNGDVHLAEDVAQSAFVRLAEKAHLLRRHAALAGWLHHTANFLALDVVRKEQRLKARHRHAEDPGTAGEGTPVNWGDLAPEIDSALARLSEPDRTAIVLRFWHARSFPEIAAELGTNEPACRKRVARSLERLRRELSRLGIVSVAGLEDLLASPAARGFAPPSLTTAILAHTAGLPAGSPILGTILGIMSSVKIVFTVTVAVLIVSGGFQLREHAQIRSLELKIDDVRAHNRQWVERENRPKAVVRARVPAVAKARPFHSLDSAKTAGERFLAEHPEARTLMQAERVARTGMDHATFYIRAGLTDAQIAQFEAILAQEDTDAWRTSATSAGLIALPLHGALSEAAETAQLQTLLGAAGYGEYQRSRRYHGALDMASDLASAASGEDPLTAAQAAQLVETIQAANGNWTAVMDGAKPLLSPAQFTLLAGMRDQILYTQAEHRVVGATTVK